MFQHILVPLDGSQSAEQALPVAARIARATHASLTLLQIIPPMETLLSPIEPQVFVEDFSEDDVAEAKDYLSEVERREAFDGLGIRIEVRIGPIGATLLHFAREQDIDLIVMSSHGRTGLKRWIMGSVARHVARESTIPTLILRSNGPSPITANNTTNEQVQTTRVLVALDGSPLAETILSAAAGVCAALAMPEHGNLHLVRVVHVIPTIEEHKEMIAQINTQALADARAYLEEIEQRIHTGAFAAYHLNVSVSVVLDSSGTDIPLRLIETSTCAKGTQGFDGCDIIALATHGRRGLRHLIEGSFAEEVFDTTRLPLLVMHPLEAQIRKNVVAAFALV